MNRTVTLSAHIAWWWKWYSAGLYMAMLTTGLSPDPEKVARTAVKALTWKVS